MISLLSFSRGSLCLAVCASALAGCTTVNSVERAEPLAEKQMVADKRVITDAGLNRKASIVAVNETTVGAGFTKVQVELLNNSRSAFSFTYHFDWFDGQGMHIETPTASWIDRTIQGKEVMDITAVSPTESARDFRVKFLSR